MLVRHENPDTLAAFLLTIGRHASQLPAVWDAGKISYPVAGPNGEFIGNLLPGRGLLLFDDLKQLGITRSLPNVFEYSLAFRLRDLLKSERGAITTYAGLMAARATYKHGFCGLWAKTLNHVGNVWAHIWQNTIGFPGAGTYTNIPGGAVHDQTTTGALNWGFAKVTNPDKAFLVSCSLGCSGAYNMAIAVDLLVCAGNIDSNSASAQTVNTTALNRYTSGSGVLAFLDVTSALSSGAANITLNKYTNEAGTANRSSVANAAVTSAVAQRIPYSTCTPFFALQAGDSGMQSVEEITFSAAMGGTGKVALCLCKPLIWIPGLAAGMHAKRDDMSNINGAVELSLTSGDLMGCFSLLSNGVGTGADRFAGDFEIAVGS